MSSFEDNFASSSIDFEITFEGIRKITQCVSATWFHYKDLPEVIFERRTHITNSI